ncbi:ribosomal-processing cysteine protease Prp [Enterococcus olivae]
MIKGTFTRNASGHIVSYEITGHAYAGEFGSDIVCAAVSVLAISTVNGIDALAGVEPIIDEVDEEAGYLYVAVPAELTQEQTNIIQILLENLLLGLQAVQEGNSDHIQIETLTKS